MQNKLLSPSLCSIQKLTYVMLLGFYGFFLWFYPLNFAFDTPFHPFDFLQGKSFFFLVVLTFMLALGGGYRSIFTPWGFMMMAVACLAYVLSFKNTILQSFFHPFNLMTLWAGMIMIDRLFHKPASYRQMFEMNLLMLVGWVFSFWVMVGIFAVMCVYYMPALIKENRLIYIGGFLGSLCMAMMSLAELHFFFDYSLVVNYYLIGLGGIFAILYFFYLSFLPIFYKIKIPNGVMMILCAGLIFTCTMMMGYHTMIEQPL